MTCQCSQPAKLLLMIQHLATWQLRVLVRATLTYTLLLPISCSQLDYSATLEHIHVYIAYVNQQGSGFSQVGVLLAVKDVSHLSPFLPGGGAAETRLNKLLKQLYREVVICNNKTRQYLYLPECMS